ncbi:hypothetical protein FOA52_002671 [Chlamydomonas sp. UWO 241]|nr:hypothetical protein FOA52_002671 [Chlamydomonas sp. UWO 241]
MGDASTSGAPEFVSNTLRQAGGNPKLLTLVLVHQGDRLLLGEKKRGFGVGYYNGFGGKLEPGETVEDAAQRELEEEACIQADGMEHAGVLTFVFDDNPQPWEVHVFRVRAFAGTPSETEEMRPVWFPQDAPPFAQMWADDPFWYPLFLRGAHFNGLFAFTHSTQLVWHTLGETAAAAAVGGDAAALSGAIGACTWAARLGLL